MLKRDSSICLKQKQYFVSEMMLLTYILLTCSIPGASAFYLPGHSSSLYCWGTRYYNNLVDGRSFCQKKAHVYVNRLNSVEHIIPYEYHDFDFCYPPEDVAMSPSENLGQVVFGDRIRPSLYEVNFIENVECRTVCEKTYKSGDGSMDKLTFLKRAIRLNYQHHWILDNMPITSCYKVQAGEQYCSTGFPIGCYVTKMGKRKDTCVTNDEFKTPNTYYLFNHVDIMIDYHPESSEDWFQNHNGGVRGRIVNAKLIPRSIKHQKEGSVGCINAPVLGIPGDLKGKLSFRYTYSVTWRENKEIKWSSRWDYILESMPHTNIQWFSICNALVIVLLLFGIAAICMHRTLHKDIAKYNRMSSLAEAEEEFGWKLVHEDVFRPPRKGIFFSVLVGNGTQLFLMTVITLVLACLGLLSPANQGALMTCALYLYVCLGTPAGYVSARLYKTFGGKKWISNALLTALYCPGLVFGVFFLGNLVHWGCRSSAAVPFTTLLILLALWFGVSVPLTLVGAYFGFKKKPIEYPTNTYEIPCKTPSPNKSLCFTLCGAMVMGGILPFGCTFTQMFFILNSIWSHQVYYSFGFVLVDFIILIITCSVVTILICYFNLRAKNNHWWWGSFLTSGSFALYFFLYCVHFYINKLEMNGFVSAFLYFGYTLIMAFLVFLVTGSVGFFACFLFLFKIFSVVKAYPPPYYCIDKTLDYGSFQQHPSMQEDPNKLSLSHVHNKKDQKETDSMN